MENKIVWYLFCIFTGLACSLAGVNHFVPIAIVFGMGVLVACK